MRLSTSEFKLSSKMYICEYAYEWTKDKRDSTRLSFKKEMPESGEG